MSPGPTAPGTLHQHDCVEGVGPAAAAVALSQDDSEVSNQMRWAVGLLIRAERQVTEDDRNRFVPAFLSKHPAGLGPLVRWWRDAGPYELESYEAVAHKAWATVRGPRGELHTLSAVVGTGGLIRILTLSPESRLPLIAQWSDVDSALTAPGVTTSFLAARLRDGQWQTLHEMDPDRSMPCGSTFKLYILHAVAEAVARGELRWDEDLVLLPNLRSLPTGDLQDLPDGSRCRVRHATNKMISTSDNTGSDMLMKRVGRAAVEHSVATLGHHDPGVLVPFPASREIFEISWGQRDLRAAWTAADRSARRALLDSVGAVPITVRIADMVDPTHPLGLDWYLSAWDIARALRGLREEPSCAGSDVVDGALSSNPGIFVDARTWPRVAFKGGSNPGLISFCWLLEDAAGDAYAVVIQQSALDPALVRDGGRLLRLARQIVDRLLSQAGQP